MILLATCAVLGLAVLDATQAIAPYTLEQVMGYSFPADLTASAEGERVAWTTVHRGVRNIWIARGPDFRPRMLTSAREEDGQELANLGFSKDGRYLVWTRGGVHGANWQAEGNLMPNPTSSPVQPKLEIWSAPVDGEPTLVAEGEEPALSPGGDRVAFERGREIWGASLDGSRPAARMFFARGTSESPVWSPDGRKLAFVSNRGAHGYIGVFTSESDPIQYIAPSTSQDSGPRWSPDGSKIAFVRRPGRGGPSRPPLETQPQPWAIWVVDIATGAARQIWQSAATLRGSFPRVEGGANLQWAAGNRLVFISYEDGWPHLYSIPSDGGNALLLTPGAFMVEHAAITPDRRFLVYNANTGSDADDIERRHLFKVAVDAAAPVPLTSGTGIEWNPVVTSDGKRILYLASDARRPPAPYVRDIDAQPAAAGRALEAGLAAYSPSSQLVTPEHVTYKAGDGTIVHAQLFKAATTTPLRGPAIVYVHGGPPRQMLLGWHYRFYYANAYAVNQYLASRGFIVLSVNYRLGIGYGYDFQNPRRGGARGAEEYQDVLAGGRYLQTRNDVDPSRIGIWGGSYGGYLTALALGRNSDVFAAGVDIHGVHNRVNAAPEALEAAAAVGDGVTPAQLAEAARVAWESSPAAYVDTWRSPVLVVHGDDDRNVRIDQTIDLVQRLRAKAVRLEEIIIPDDVHDFLLYRNWLRVNRATVDFFDRTLKAESLITNRAIPNH